MLWVCHIQPLLCWGSFFCAYFLGSFGGFFNHKWVLNFVKSFLCMYWGDYMFLSFNLLRWCITLIDFCILKNPCIPGIKPTWSLCMILLMCAGFCLLEFCWRVLHLCSLVILACCFLYLWHLCLVLVSGWWRPFLLLQFSGRVWAGFC